MSKSAKKTLVLKKSNAWTEEERNKAQDELKKHSVADNFGRLLVQGGQVRAILSMDWGNVRAIWGDPMAVMQAVVAELHKKSAGKKDRLWRCFDYYGHAGVIIRAQIVETVWRQRLPWIHSDLRHAMHLKSSPNMRSHLMIEKRAVEEWRKRPHVVAEAAIAMKKDAFPMWQRTVVWFNENGQLNMEPPVARWGKKECDRTLCVRMANGMRKELLEGGKARISKMFGITFFDDLGFDTVEAVMTLGDGGNKAYADEWAEVEKLKKRVEDECYEAVARIQRAWRNAISNPASDMCQRRLHREFEQMSEA